MADLAPVSGREGRGLATPGVVDGCPDRHARPRQGSRTPASLRAKLAKQALAPPREGHPRPFYISYLLHTLRGLDVWGRYGSVFNSEPVQSCDLYAEVRVGTHRFDQSVDGSLHTELSDRESFNWLAGPQDMDDDTVRYAFWKLTDHKYKEALQEYYEKKKILIEQHLRKHSGIYSKEPPFVLNERIRPVKFSAARWEGFVRSASSLFRKHRRLIDPYVRVRGASRVRIFVNSGR